jgi:CHASE3 domain sensor protein
LRQEPRSYATRTWNGLVYGAIGVLLVLVLVGVAIAVWLILDLRNATDHLTERNVDYAATIDDIALISKTLANDERGFLISGAEEFRDQFEGRVSQVYEAYERAYATADSEQWERVDGARDSFERWLSVTRANMAAYAAGERDEAVERSLDETRELRKEYEARLAGMQSLAAFRIESASETVAGTVTRAVAILLGYLVLALVIGLAVAAWVVREVVRPAREMRDRLEATSEVTPRRASDLA